MHLADDIQTRFIVVVAVDEESNERASGPSKSYIEPEIRIDRCNLYV